MAKRSRFTGLTKIAVKLELLKRGRLSFNAFCRDVIKVEPTWQQQQFIDNWDKGERSHAIRSGHGTGKSTVLGWFVIFYLLSYKDALIPITGSAFDQVKKTLWKEVTRAYRRLPPQARNQLDKYASEIRRKDNPEESVAFIRTADEGDNFQGFHSPHMVFIVDEASAVADDIFEVIDGAMTEDDNGIVMTGNPTQLSGEFYDAFHRNRTLYAILRWNGEESPLVSKNHLEKLEKKYNGRDSNEYKVRVLGDFPDSEEMGLINLADIEACVELGRQVTAGTATVDDSGPLVYGVDVGRQGSDPSVICRRKGNMVFELQSRHGMKGPEVASWVQGQRKKDSSSGCPPQTINVDVIGLGASAYDHLELDKTCPVQDVNVALTGKQYVEESDRFLNVRAETYWRLKEEVESRELALPDDDELVQELAAIRYEFTSKGLIKMEEKERMKGKGRLGRSPDKADSLKFTYYKNIEKEFQHFTM